MLTTRRTLLQALTAPFLFAAGTRALRSDVAIIGGGFGGCAAALAALRNGMRVVMTEETDWIGGQVTSQGVPPDEHPWIESFGGTLAYRQYRSAVREDRANDQEFYSNSLREALFKKKTTMFWRSWKSKFGRHVTPTVETCLLYTSDAADE